MSGSTETLHLDILEVIIDLSDSKTLLQWSLSCKTLSTRARSRIFSHITLNNKTCQQLHDLLSTSPYLEKFVVHIAIRDMEYLQHGRARTALLPIAISVLRQLRHLQTVSLLPEGYMGYEWTKVENMMKETLFECFQLETIQGVDAQFFRHCRSFLERCPRLKHLDLYHPIEDFTRTSPHIARIELKSLRVAVYADVERDASIEGVLGSKGDPLFDFSHLERLSTLQELFWEVSTPDITSETLEFRLSGAPSLQTLVVRFNLEHQPVKPAECYRWVIRILDSRSPLDPIKKPTFSLPWDDDPVLLCDLVATIQGSNQIELYIAQRRTPLPSGMFSQARECALQRQPGIDIQVMGCTDLPIFPFLIIADISPAFKVDTFRVLRLQRPFGHSLAAA
ncbi:hypothetical protein DL96DRAFT_1709930 [Flagelloscypha sp. PMI_526]|nr:hypothetical protein DL96DRAFT_1709930 [Flagelloscypha sp. PMI_526]